jgi:hypothetical protein
VAISINLTKILEVRGLVGRAGEAIVLHVAVLIVSTLVLVPEQPRAALGTELLVTGLLAWSILVVIHLKAVRGRIRGRPHRAVAAGARRLDRDGPGGRPGRGVSLLLQAGGGLYGLVPRVVLCLVVAVLNAWGAAHRDPAVRPSSGRATADRST